MKDHIENLKTRLGSQGYGHVHSRYTPAGAPYQVWESIDEFNVPHSENYQISVSIFPDHSGMPRSVSVRFKDEIVLIVMDLHNMTPTFKGVIGYETPVPHHIFHALNGPGVEGILPFGMQPSRR